jgi:hypothetical protein
LLLEVLWHQVLARVARHKSLTEVLDFRRDPGHAGASRE